MDEVECRASNCKHNEDGVYCCRGLSEWSSPSATVVITLNETGSCADYVENNSKT